MVIFLLSTTPNKGQRGSVGRGFCHQALCCYPWGIYPLEMSCPGHLGHLGLCRWESPIRTGCWNVIQSPVSHPETSSLTLALLCFLYWWSLLMNPSRILICSGKPSHQLGAFTGRYSIRQGARWPIVLCGACSHECLNIIPTGMWTNVSASRIQDTIQIGCIDSNSSSSSKYFMAY